MPKIQTETTDLGPNEQLLISTVNTSKNLPIPPFVAMGRSGTSKYKITGFDTVQTVKGLSRNSAWFFWLLVTCRDLETNLCRADKDLRLSEKEKNRIPRVYKELSSKSLVVRQRRGVYRINPKAVLPKFECFEKIWDAWCDECAKGKINPDGKAALAMPLGHGMNSVP